MFWGLLLEPGKRYSTTVEKSFHVSKAALHCSSVRNENEIISVILETEGSEALLCNLCKQRGILQETLDLNFMTGDRLTFECRGHGKIHLTGYLLPDEEDDISGMLGDEESEEEEESGWSQPPSSEKGKKVKRKPDGPPEVPPKKKKAEAGDEDEEESDSEADEESDMSDAGMDDEDLDDEEVEDEDSDKDEDEESDDEEDADFSPKKKQKQQQKTDKNKTPNKQNLDTSSKKTPVTNGISPKEQKSNKKTPIGNKSPNTTPQQKKVLDQGVVVKELKIGTGPPAKPGRMVSVYYIGKLRDGKVFDKQMKGECFKFKFGKGEVIKGWDIGLQGMKVGGKRVIHCPPEAAYGAKGVPPKIPANSSLTFEVELKAVH